MRVLPFLGKLRKKNEGIDDTNIPTFFKFIRDIQDGPDDDGDDIWFNFATPISSELCER